MPSRIYRYPLLTILQPTGVAVTPDLDSLTEQIEEQPSSPVVHAPQTPAGSSPIKPSKSEMRPGKANGAMAPPSSALRLGFTDIGDASRLESPTTAKSNKIAASATLKAVLPEDDNETPSKKRSPLSSISPFTFRFSRHKGKAAATAEEAVTVSAAPSPSKEMGTPDLGLSDEARRMMEELREEAQKIRADLEVERDQERAREEEDIANGRKIAKPKSRAGRYSAAHTAEFSKMDSIANHPSAFRASRYTPVKSTAATPSVAAATPAISSQARGLKRTQSKANLDETPQIKTARTPAVAAATSAVPGSVAGATVSPAKRPYNPLFGNNQSHGGVDNSKPPQSARKGNLLFPPATANNSPQQPMSAAKRIKQNIGDDASSSRPVSRDGSSLPRPAGLASSVSSLSRSHTTASLLTPTKASSSLARPTSFRTPGTSTATGTGTSATATATANTSSHLQHKTPSKTPSKTPLQLFSALKRSATTSSLQTSVRTPPAASTIKAVEAEKPNVSKPAPSLSRAIGSIKKTTAPAFSTSRAPAQPNTSAARSVIPVTTSFGPTVMAFSKTPAPPRMADRVVAPLVPATTPRRKLAKRVAFTPGTARAVMPEKSPSLFRSGIPRSALRNTGAQDSEMQIDGKDDVADSPSVRRRFGTTIYYPDLSGHELLGGSSSSADVEEKVLSPATTLAPPTTAPPPPSVPGTFTFRSDKTINFGQTSPTGFGSSPGQASLRQVRSSTSAVPKIPGSFPGTSHVGDVFQALVATEGANKENARPVAIIPHGITNKKRHRVSEAEEAEDEAAQRAAKKRKNAPVPEGEALLAPRLVGKTVPSSTGGNTTFGGMRSSPHKTMSPQKSALHKSSPQKMMTPQKTVTFSAAPSASKTPVAGKTPGSAAAKKRPILSMSRLNSLARPKLRK